MIKLENLRRIIDIDRGLKRKWVAQKIGLTEGSFKQVMAGNAPLSLKKAIELSKLLKVELFEIWEER